MAGKKKKKKTKHSASAARRRQNRRRQQQKRPQTHRKTESSQSVLAPVSAPEHQKQASPVKRQRPRILFAVAAALIGVFLFCADRWAERTWPALSMDELRFHLHATVDGTGADIVRSGMLQVVLPTVAAGAVAALILLLLKKHRRSTRGAGISIMIGSLLLGLFGILSLSIQLNLLDYLTAGWNHSVIVDESYVDPEEANIRFPERKRNLIYIYLESMETTFADREDGGWFRRDRMPELTKLALENECFAGDTDQLNGPFSTVGASWTAGAMFAQTTGIPFPSALGNDVKIREDALMPEVVSLGDLLQDAGYQRALLVGSNAEFGWRGYYYRSHGDYTILDYPHYIETGALPSDYFVWWGFEDEKLFSFAKEELTQMSSQDAPFALTLLTVDTHFEDGYVCQRCKRPFGKDQYSNVIACSSRQVASFVRWCQKQDFYENTTIILCGDHITMDSDYCNDVDETYPRRVYLSIINAPVQPALHTPRTFVTLDMFPTTLTSLGATFDGDRLGLGTDMFGTTPSLAEEYGVKEFESEFYKQSDVLEHLTTWEYAPVE